jgi:dTDP-4-dehydrorhamnose 3,5-epimerase
VTIEPTTIPDVRLIIPKRHGDHRGFFAEVYSREALRKSGVDVEFVQDNHSLSREKGVVRGLHFQLNPAAQAKLIRVVQGAILDVAVDIRRNSPTFGQHVACELSAENFHQLYIPAGFAHGFLTLTPNCEVVYKVSSVYSPQHDRGILWNDPDLKIDWPVASEAVVLSDKDRKQPRLKDAPELF